MIGGGIVESFTVTFLAGCEGAVNGLTVPGKVTGNDVFLIGGVSIVTFTNGVRFGSVAFTSTDRFDGAEVIPTVTAGVVRFPIRSDEFVALTLSDGAVTLLDGGSVFGTDDKFARAKVTSATIAVFCGGDVVLEIWTAFDVLLIGG